MNLGLGLIAANSYFKEGDAQKTRDYEQARRDAEISSLGDKTAAQRSGYRLSDARNSAAVGLVPMQTANSESQLGLQSAELSAQTERQPTDLKTKDIQSSMGLTEARSAQRNQPLQQAVKSNQLQSAGLQSADELKQLPAKLSRAATQGVLDQQGQSDVVLGTMGQLIARQDKAAAINFANQIAKQSNVGPEDNGMTLKDIVPVRKGDSGAPGDGYNFITSDGQSKFVPVEAIAGAQEKLKSGKYDFIHSKDGSVFAGNESTGAVKQVYQGDPTGQKTQNSPAEVQTMQWLMSNNVAKDAPAAWEMVRSAREKTRNSFIMDYTAKNAMPGQDGTKMAADAGAIYDQVQKATGSQNTRAPGLDNATQAPGAGNNWDQWLEK